MAITDLMQQVRQRRPRISLLLRGNEDEPDWVNEFGTRMPVLIPREADGKVVASGLDRAFRSKVWDGDPVVSALFDKIHDYPSLPSLYTQVVNELESPTGSIEMVGWHISQDPIMTAKILQTVNSALYCLPQQINDPGEAVMFLGVERCKSLILLSKLFSQFDNKKCAGFSMERMWQHSIVVGSFARFIALAESQDGSMADQAYTAGLLHDIGKVLLAGNLPQQYQEVTALHRNQDLPVYEAEKKILGTTHAELAGCLLDHWGLGPHIVEAVTHHHRPLECPHIGFNLLTAVHAANALSYKTKGNAHHSSHSEVDTAYLEKCGLTESYKSWGQLCGYAPKFREN
jgi:HD-like signal output (HDOD) protein